MKGIEMKQKVEFYLVNKINIHVETDSGRFYNGILLECSDKHLVIMDRVLGEMFILFSEIKLFEKFKEAKEDEREID